MVDEDLDNPTHSNFMEEEPFFNEENTSHTSKVPSKISELIATISTPKVFTPPASSV